MRNMNSEGTLNAHEVLPDEIDSGDRYGYKFVAVVYEDHWIAYRGSTDWTDERVIEDGEYVDRKLAIAMFPDLQNDRDYR
jgi:hypothetical protein